MVKREPATIFYASAPTIFVHDLEATRSFYVDVLGFHELRRIGENNILLSAPGVTILLRKRGGEAPVEPTTMLLGFMVHDIRVAMDELAAKGVVFEGETAETPLAKVRFFSDPAGTSLYICEWL